MRRGEEDVNAWGLGGMGRGDEVAPGCQHMIMTAMSFRGGGKVCIWGVGAMAAEEEGCARCAHGMEGRRQGMLRVSRAHGGMRMGEAGMGTPECCGGVHMREGAGGCATVPVYQGVVMRMGGGEDRHRCQKVDPPR